MNKIEIKKKLKRVFEKRFHIKLGNFTNEIYDCHFFNKSLMLTPRDLLYLLFDIEKEFNIIIPQKDIAVGKFSTFNNIVNIISEQLEVNESKVLK